MTALDLESFTHLLLRSRDGEEAALDELLPLVHDELRAIAGRQLRRQGRTPTLQATALVNPVWLRVADQKVASLADRQHFLALCARVNTQAYELSKTVLFHSGAIDGANFAANQYSFGMFTYAQSHPANDRQFEVINFWVE